MGPRSLAAIYNAKAPPSATPAIAIIVVRNGRFSMVPVAPEDLEDLEVEAGEDDVELEAGLEVLEEAGKSS